MDLEEENVKVVVRIRPMQTEEKKSGDIPCVKAINDGREVQVKVGPLDAQVYRCNNCFDTETNQVDFFAECGITDLLDSAIQGYRACAFAFGQTGAGKTHTMIGSAKGISSRDKNVGLIPRSLDYLYEKLSQMNIPYKIKLSCLEIYHEHVYDLFAEDKERTPMAVREHNIEGFFLEGARLVDCSNYNIACNVLDVAFKNRQVGFHDLNSRSSRSHCVTEIYIETYPNTEENPDQVVRGKMTLVDLAGSERLKSTNSTGKVLQEAGFINRSLYVLGKVIAGLVRTNGDLNHKDVPYRDSKLTKLLISSLGGSSRTLMISCVSEAKGSQAETLRTLKFSMSCARIRNKPVKFLDPQEKLIFNLKDEIRRLRQENQQLRSNLLTAPSGSNSVQSLMGEDMSPNRVRASSANGSLSPTRRRISPEKMRNSNVGISKKRTTGPGQNTTNGRKTTKSSTKKNSNKKKPEIFYKYPQLERILSDNDSVGGAFTSSPNRGRMRPSKDIVGNRSHNHHHRQPQSSASESIMMTHDNDVYDTQPYDTTAGGESADELGSVHSHQSHHSRKVGVGGKRHIDVLDEMVHRRAPGPMIFKDVQHAPYEPLRESRLNKYYPAENHLKSMDQMKIDILEQRIAKMEAQQQRLEQLQGGGAVIADAGGSGQEALHSQYHDNHHGHAPNPAYDDEATIQNSIAIDGSELVKAGKKPAGSKKNAHPKKKKEKKTGISPYIAHLDTGKLQAFQQNLAEPQAKPRAELPLVKPSSKQPPVVPPAQVKSKPPTDKNAYPVERKAANVAEVRNSIDKELEELGLSEILGMNKPMLEKSAVANMIASATNTKSSKSTSHLQSNHANDAVAGNKKPPSNATTNNKPGPNKSQSLPQIQSKQQQVDGGALISAAASSTRKRGSKDAGDKTKGLDNKDKEEKLPAIANTNSEKKKPSPITTVAGNVSPSKVKKPTSSPSKAPHRSPAGKKMEEKPVYHEDEDDFMPPTPDRLKEKLHQLESSLVSKRIEMEDNPGDVTNEIEEKFKNLQLETLVIKQQLSELTGDMFPEPEHPEDTRANTASTTASDERHPESQISPAKTTKESHAKKEEEEEEDEEYYGDEDFENDDPVDQASRARGSPEKSKAEVSVPSPPEPVESTVPVELPAKSSPVQPVLLETNIAEEDNQSPKDDTIEQNAEEDGYEDDYDVDFEQEDDDGNGPKPKSKAASPVKASTTPIKSQLTPTSVTQAADITHEAIVQQSADASDNEPEIAVKKSTPSPTKRAKTPAKGGGEEDDDAYADDFDVSFNEDD